MCVIVAFVNTIKWLKLSLCVYTLHSPMISDVHFHIRYEIWTIYEFHNLHIGYGICCSIILDSVLDSLFLNWNFFVFCLLLLLFWLSHSQSRHWNRHCTSNGQKWHQTKLFFTIFFSVSQHKWWTGTVSSIFWIHIEFAFDSVEN